MRAKTVRLHGGPYHGHTIAVPEGNNHFHVVGTQPVAYGDDDQKPVGVQEGTYSQVSGPNHQHDFEWDGWVSH